LSSHLRKPFLAGAHSWHPFGNIAFATELRFSS
jgi:hypothetical protein